MTYRVQYLDHSGLLRESFSPGSDAYAAIANVQACEPRCYRVVSCKPRPCPVGSPTPYCEPVSIKK